MNSSSRKTVFIRLTKEIDNMRYAVERTIDLSLKEQEYTNKKRSSSYIVSDEFADLEDTLELYLREKGIKREQA